MGDDAKKVVDEDIIDEVDDEGEDDQPGADDKKAGGEKGKEKKPGKSFTQDEVSAMMAKEKKQGRGALLRELGVKNEEELKVLVQAQKDAEDAKKSEEQKQAEAKNADAAKIQELEMRAMQADAKVEALKQGARKDTVDDVIVLAMGKLTDDGDLVALIGEIKTKYPILFEEPDPDEEKKPGQKGTGGAIGSGQKGSKNEKTQSMGQRLAAQKVQQGVKSSYWE